MIQKKVLTNIISKYHLNGGIEKVTWVCDKEETSNKLLLEFVNDSRSVAGDVICNKINLKEGKYGVYSTSYLNKIINILDGEILIEPVKQNGILTKLSIADTNFDATFSLSDPKVLPKKPAITDLGEADIIFKATEEFFNRFIKAKNASIETDIFSLHSQEGFSGNEVIFSIGGEKGNKINFSVDSDIEYYNGHIEEPMGFNADLLKEILRSNQDCEGIFKIYSKGLIHCNFIENLDDQIITSNYYLVRQQIN